MRRLAPILAILISAVWFGTAHAQTDTPTPTPTQTPTATQIPINYQLVSCWDMDETSGTRYDSISSNHLTDNNTVGYGSGLVGNSARFIKNNDESLSVQSSDFELYNHDFTIIAWINLDDINGASNKAIDKFPDLYIRYIKYTNAFEYQVYVFSEYHTSSHAVAFPDWVLISLWYDSSQSKAYYRTNNSYEHSFDVSPNLDTNNILRIGKQFVSDGNMDVCGFWDRVLTESELSYIYNSGYGRECVELLPTPTPTPTSTPSGQRQIDLASGDWMTVKREVSYGDLSTGLILGVLLIGFAIFGIIFTVDRWLRK